MKGHVRERGAGNWYAVIDIHDLETGKRKRKWHSLDAKTKRDAQTECATLISAVAGGTYMPPKAIRFSVYLDEWLKHIKQTVSPRTHERYAELAEKYVKPTLGGITLIKLQPMALSGAYDQIRTMRTKGVGELSPRTVLHCHRLVHNALRQAVRWRLIPHNPASDVKAPRVPRRQMATHSLVDTVDMLEGLRGHWMFVPAVLGLLCGMRRGEIAALRWAAVDLDRGQISVVYSAEKTKTGIRYDKEPKTNQARTLALSPTVIEELRAHRLQLAQDFLKLGKAIGPDDFVVAQADSSPYDPDSISKEWRTQVIKSGLRRIRFHDTRHTHATHMLAANVHPKIASERMGHSRVGVTLDTYSHVLEGMQNEAVSAVDAAMAQALHRRAAGKQG